MRRKRNYSIDSVHLGLWLGLVFLVSCTPGGDEVVVTRATPTEVPSHNGWCDDGAEVIQPDDVGCFSDRAGARNIQWINSEMAVLHPDLESIDNWAGAAIIYHPDSNSMLVFDTFGDVVPEKSVFNGRTGVVAFDELSENVELIAGLKQDIQARWQTTSPEEPKIQISVVWQDGETTIFMAAIGGLSPENNIFYCKGHEWVVGDLHIKQVVTTFGCENDSTPLVKHIFFELASVKGDEVRSVQLTMADNLQSNELMVSAGVVTTETAVYEAVLNQMTTGLMLVSDETAVGFDPEISDSFNNVETGLLENYKLTNEKSISLRFLFEDTAIISSARYDLISQDNFSTEDLEWDCEFFRSRYPQWEGIVTFSQIGFNEDGSRALVHAFIECETAETDAAYYLLEKTEDGWQVIEAIPAAAL